MWKKKLKQKTERTSSLETLQSILLLMLHGIGILTERNLESRNDKFKKMDPLVGSMKIL